MKMRMRLLTLVAGGALAFSAHADMEKCMGPDGMMSKGGMGMGMMSQGGMGMMGGGGMGNMPMMKEHRAKMREHMQKMKSAKAGPERTRMMEEHMQMMDDHMAMMMDMMEMMAGGAAAPEPATGKTDGKAPPPRPAGISEEEHKAHHPGAK